MSKLIDDEDYYFFCADEEEAVFTDETFSEMTNGKGEEDDDVQ